MITKASGVMNEDGSVNSISYWIFIGISNIFFNYFTTGSILLPNELNTRVDSFHYPFVLLALSISRKRRAGQLSQQKEQRPPLDWILVYDCIYYYHCCNLIGLHRNAVILIIFTTSTCP